MHATGRRVFIFAGSSVIALLILFCGYYQEMLKNPIYWAGVDVKSLCYQENVIQNGMLQNMSRQEVVRNVRQLEWNECMDNGRRRLPAFVILSNNEFWRDPVGHFCLAEPKAATEANASSNISVHVHDEVINNSLPLTTQADAKAGEIDDRLNKTLYITAANLAIGRLGNQLFIYASLFGIARAQGRTLIVSPGSDLQKTFKLQHVDGNNTNKDWKVIGEANALSFDKKLMKLPFKDFKIAGYLQSYTYFRDFSYELRQEFIFHDYIANSAAEILHDVYAENRGSMVVGVHVRRGDFLRDYNQKFGYIVPEKSYFTKAFEWMKSKFPGRNITFLVASDDLPWCNITLKADDVILMPDTSPAVHIATLASCDHVIISSGSFGWWSGWLAGGYVIYFAGFMPKNTSLGDTFVAEDYYPTPWIGLEN